MVPSPLIGVTWMPTVKAVVVIAVALGWSASCGKTEEPPAEPRRDPTPASATAARGAPGKASAASPRCVVQTSTVAAPAAKPAERCPEDPTGNFDLPKGTVTFVDAKGQPEIAVELARQDEHRARGLMYRTRLSDEAGMLFSWSDEQVRSFWMKNTCLPLDMLFIARDGTIVGILEQVPTLNEAPRSIPCPAAHVLEVNAGWTRQRGVRAGQKVVIDS